MLPLVLIKRKGFTKSPINNPGNIAIRAAINPINTGDIFYITGNDGNMYMQKIIRHI